MSVGEAGGLSIRQHGCFATWPAQERSRSHSAAESRLRFAALLKWSNSGSKRDLQLSVDGERRLADIISSSPVQCKMSVCWGERVSVPRLFWGADNSGDCGASSDFVSITPDMKMQSCSFHDAGFDIDSADDILKAWRTQQALLATPSSRFGCARRTASMGSASGEAAISVWQAFSGNNSGECVLVAKFETNEEAEKYLAELLPGLNNGTDELPPEWKAILKQEGIRLTGYDLSDYSETELARVGKTVLATTYAADDAFTSSERCLGSATRSGWGAGCMCTTSSTWWLPFKGTECRWKLRTALRSQTTATLFLP